MQTALSNGSIFNALVLKNPRTELGFVRIAEPRGAKDCSKYNKITRLRYLARSSCPNRILCFALFASLPSSAAHRVFRQNTQTFICLFLSDVASTTEYELEWFWWFELRLGLRISRIKLSCCRRLTDKLWVQFLFHFGHNQCIPSTLFDSDANLIF